MNKVSPSHSTAMSPAPQISAASQATRASEWSTQAQDGELEFKRMAYEKNLIKKFEYAIVFFVCLVIGFVTYFIATNISGGDEENTDFPDYTNITNSSNITGSLRGSLSDDIDETF